MNNGGNILAWVKVIGTLILTVLLGYLLYKLWGLVKDLGSKAKDAAGKVATYVTGGPNDHNFISRGADSLLGIPDDMTLGTKIADWFQTDPIENQKRVELEQNTSPLSTHTFSGDGYLYEIPTVL